MRVRNIVFLYLIIPAVAFAQSANHVVISEVFFLGLSSPATEFVELYNPTPNDIVLTGYKVQAGTTGTPGSSTGEWAVDLTGITIKGYGFLLIGQPNVSPAADLAIPSGKGLLNGNTFRAGVRLFNTNSNTVVDAVGWDPTATSFVEGTANTSAGVTSSSPKSLERKAQSSSSQQSMSAEDALLGNGWDTDDNSIDFVLRDVPQPQNSSSSVEMPFSGPDTIAPRVLSLKTLSSTQIELQFNEPLDSITASTPSNYSIDNGIAVTQAARHATPISRVTLTVSTMSNGTYSLTVNGVQDTSGNAMSAPQIVNFSFGVISIAQARALGPGGSAKVRGIVTVGNEFGNPAFLQDSTGGLAVFNFNFAASAKQGDIWEVGGTLKNFNGLLEIDPLTDSLKISSGNPLPKPKLLVSDQLDESFESQLVRIDRAKFALSGSFGSGSTDSSYSVSDAHGSFIVRVDGSTNIPGSPIPADSVNIVGVVNEFNGSYRLMPRSFADIGVVDPPPDQNWLDISVARSMGTGAAVKVRGVVTYNQPGSIIYIQDKTAGLALFDAKTDTLAEGDSVEAVGPLVQFNNLLEMQPVDTLKLLARSVPVPSPKLVTIPQASEFYESQLILIHSVRFVQSGTFSGNTNYNITDGTNQTQVRIPTGTLLVGQNIPAGAIDIAGILGQFQANYQLIPRGSGDLIPLPGPQITSTPQVVSLSDNGFTVSWTTIIEGNSVLSYGTTPNLTDSIVSATPATNHSIAVSGLTAGRIYYVRVSSSDGSGTSSSTTFPVVTTSSASTGQIHVYFNFPVDATLGLSPPANASIDLGQKLLERISAATKSIDFALYSFDDFNASPPNIAQRVADSIVAAKNRGVKVRMVFHDRANTAPLNTLIGGGISVIKRDVPGGSGMHNKFWVFDGRDTTSATDDWLITGSWNVTDEGTFFDAQNAVFIQDQSLARVYTLEFEEMFGSGSETANVSFAKFGPEKSDNTPHWTLVNGTKIEVFFSPSDRTSSRIAAALSIANQNIYFGQFSFTRDEIGAEIIAKKNSGVITRGIIDNTGDSGTEYGPLLSAGVDVRAAGHSVVTGQFHHKYGIVDPFDDASDPIVITGSHNWSSSAENDNDENTLIIHSGPIARQFTQEFSKRYTESGGTNPILGVKRVEGQLPGTFELSQNFPNPFNPGTNLEFSIPQTAVVSLKVYDVMGREIAVLLDARKEAGTYRVSWDASAFSSGVYFYRIHAGAFIETKKMLLMR
ncbi:MAG: T9SS type A sorting domain-containing protein [Ignavibacteriales bacterium]|nr:T9SS type A sorting domain-containing protein [Ignavibacteriales bacterium]